MEQVQDGPIKVLIVKLKMTDNAQAICDNTDLISVAEMTIDIKLLDLNIRSTMSWHRSISSLVRVKVRIKVICFLHRLLAV